MSEVSEYSVVIAELRVGIYEEGFGDTELHSFSVILPAIGLMDPDRQIRFLEAFKTDFAEHADKYIGYLRGTRPKPKLRLVKVVDE